MSGGNPHPDKPMMCMFFVFVLRMITNSRGIQLGIISSVIFSDVGGSGIDRCHEVGRGGGAAAPPKIFKGLTVGQEHPIFGQQLFLFFVCLLVCQWYCVMFDRI